MRLAIEELGELYCSFPGEQCFNTHGAQVYANDPIRMIGSSQHEGSGVAHILDRVQIALYQCMRIWQNILVHYERFTELQSKIKICYLIFAKFVIQRMCFCIPPPIMMQACRLEKHALGLFPVELDVLDDEHPDQGKSHHGSAANDHVLLS